MFDMNRTNILAFANHMESLDPALYDQTRDVHDDGNPSCLLSHLLQFFEPDTRERTTHPRNPRVSCGRRLKEFSESSPA